MKKYNLLKYNAQNLGLDLWNSGGYFYLSGFIRGKLRQGIFSNLSQVESQLIKENRFRRKIKRLED